MEEKKYLREHDVGTTFTNFCVVRKRDIRTSRNGSRYLVLEVGDRSGRLSGNVWEDVDNFYLTYPEGAIIKLMGVIDSYQGRKQFNIKKIRLAQPEDEVDQNDFLPTTATDPEKNINLLRNVALSLTNPHLRKLLISFFDDPAVLPAWTRAPGGKLWHHDRIGGLVEHTLGICRLCRLLARLYPDINRDLLIAGAILHDIGKIEEFTYKLSIDYSDRGRLVGHITIGSEMAAKRITAIEGFPKGLADQLQHLILSHQAEYGSPVKPATREAFLLHYADQIDSKMDALNSIAKELPPGEKWAWVNLLEQYVNFPER